MSWQVIIRPKAEIDLEKARLWWNSKRQGLGEQLLDEIRSAVNYLKEHPERRPFYYRGFRRFLTRRFHYKIFYRIEGERVIVFRILHAKQDHREQIKT